MKLNLFQRIARTTRKAVETIISTFKETEVAETIIEPAAPKTDEYRLEELKEKYRPLFTEAHNKYKDIQDLGLEDISRAYQTTGGDFYVDDIYTMDELFREVARAQVFISDPTSNPTVAKQVIEDAGIDIYVGRGNGSDDLKEFWRAVNMAKEDPAISGALALRQYSGAFEYLYQVWNETPDPKKIRDALFGYVRKYYEGDWKRFSQEENFNEDAFKKYYDYWSNKATDMGSNENDMYM